MADRPGFRPRPAAPMVSPALSEEDDGDRLGIRQALYDRFGPQPTRRFASNPSEPDLMPRRMAVGPSGEPLPEGSDGMGGAGESGDVQAMIADYLGPKIMSVPPEVLAEIASALKQLKGLGWLTRDAVKYVIDGMERGLSGQTAVSRFIQSHGG